MGNGIGGGSPLEDALAAHRLPPAPPSPWRALDHATLVGTYQGALDEVRWGYEGGWLRSQVRRAVYRRRWFEIVLVTRDRVLVLCLRDEGTSGALWLATDGVEEHLMARPLRSLVVGAFAGEGCEALVRVPDGRCSLRREPGDSAWTLELATEVVEGTLRLETVGGPAPVTIIGERAHRRPSLTSHWTCLCTTGRLRIDGVEVDLDGALASLEYTNAFHEGLPTWRTVLGTGRTDGGAPFALAVGSGERNAGQHEAAVWLDGEVGASEPVGIWRREGSWRLEGSGWDVRFTAVDVTREPVRRPFGTTGVSRWVGTFEGLVPGPTGLLDVTGARGICALHGSV
ncbi:MAG: DUF2804 family protein [Alphaproteobacteria bacterium]|nr:DUF2804 family protein [Alphaproteobacteria bacterium]